MLKKHCRSKWQTDWYGGMARHASWIQVSASPSSNCLQQRLVNVIKDKSALEIRNRTE